MHFIGKKFIPRRTFLRGAGFCIGLPLLDAMIPAMARAATGSPLRMVYMYFPHGVHPNLNSWKATTAGTGFSFPAGLANTNMVNFKQDIVLLGGILNYWGQYGINGDVNNDHAAATSSFLTGARAAWNAPGTTFTLSNANASAGPLPETTSVRSVDSIIADHIGAGTKIPVLHLTPTGNAAYDGGTANFNPAYRTYLSWKTSNTPTPRYERPSAAFTALFGSGTPITPPPVSSGPDLNSRKKSILSLALSEANALKSKLGNLDRMKLDEYLTSIEEVERSITTTPVEPPPPTCTPGTAPSNNLDFPAFVKANLDLIVLAFQCDMTRVASYIMDYELNNNLYTWAGANRHGHHSASHGNFEEDYADNVKIVNWYANQFAYLINKMKTTNDANGNLLSQSILTMGSGTNTTGGDHPDADLPMILAGQGNGLLTTGRALNAPSNTRIANMHLSMLQKVGVNATSFGNSNGTISGL